jgi:hypothetical protein
MARGKQSKVRRLIDVDGVETWVEWDLRWRRIGVRRKYGKAAKWWTIAQLIEAIDGQKVLPLSNETNETKGTK